MTGENTLQDSVYLGTAQQMSKVSEEGLVLLARDALAHLELRSCVCFLG